MCVKAVKEYGAPLYVTVAELVSYLRTEIGGKANWSLDVKSWPESEFLGSDSGLSVIWRREGTVWKSNAKRVGDALEEYLAPRVEEYRRHVEDVVERRRFKARSRRRQGHRRSARRRTQL